MTGWRPIRSDSQPATSGPGTLAASRSPYIAPMVAGVEAERLVEVQRHEDVEHAEAARAAAEHRREEQPAQVAVARGRAGRGGGPGLARPCDRRSLGAARRTNSRIAIATTRAAMPSPRTAAAPAERGDRERRREPDDDRADVAARDVRRDRDADAAGPGTARRAARCRPGAAARRRAATRRWRRRTAGSRARPPGPRSRPRSAARRRPSSDRRLNRRVSPPKRDLERARSRCCRSSTRTTIVAGVTPNSSMIAR